MTLDKDSPELDELATALITRAREATATAGLRTAACLPRHKRVSLLVIGGPLKGTNFPINKPQVLLGRPQSDGRSEADIAIADSQVSRKHCVLEIHDLAALLVDLDSVNGTFVYGKKITSCELANLSEFRIGGTTLVLAISEP